MCSAASQSHDIASRRVTRLASFQNHSSCASMGFTKEVLAQGNGPKPVPGNKVTVHW